MVSRVFDASAFYAGIPFASQEKGFTTSVVFDEIKHIKKNHEAINALVETKRLEILEPEKRYVEKVLQKAKEAGDFQRLSRADISIIALCLQLDAELVTDDFSISNTAKHLDLKVIPIMTKGITRVVEWAYYCVGCQKSFPRLSQCPICGNELKRKLSKFKPSTNPLHK